MKIHRFGRSRFGAALVVAALAGGAVLAIPGLARNEHAPRVEYVLLNGTRFSSDQWQGKVVLVNFWTTDCASCVHEMSQMAQTFQKFHSRGFETLAVSMSYDNPLRVTHFAQRQGLPFDVTFDAGGEIAQRFGKVELTPTSLLINKRGEIVKRYLGELDFQDVQRSIERLLAQT